MNLVKKIRGSVHYFIVFYVMRIAVLTSHIDAVHHSDDEDDEDEDDDDNKHHSEAVSISVVFHLIYNALIRSIRAHMYDTSKVDREIVWFIRLSCSRIFGSALP
jgi:hypothetical protein